MGLVSQGGRILRLTLNIQNEKFMLVYYLFETEDFEMT